ncbi:hypothetical protein ASPACDRAFT_42059 [Aspergillus aculeatus ATCC 16872]|uniref:Enolase N-terminal domain-containing protein n=1 Tax=Aspergillus aculeatus (strain ATCC 16872 / CBS 172.66 / WB 5094) TaxID=690307 RepID=A0A1L9WZV5_ASPA1|nr:uncharacterized protein ASPACDRAFT_42059 [Aspergillus aculeatus ATCC 16872]OJK01795.1 hypothetical protein ASPACDRAFT_42059 [Aspergillus aculeatus ATCC 16872]
MIKAIKAAQGLDSTGNPTVQVDLTTEHGVFRAIVPSVASTGASEAVELRDGDPSNYGDKSVHKAIHNFESVIGPVLIESGLGVEKDQRKIEELLIALDGTKNKANLGANAILGVSMACAREGGGCRGER